MSIELAAKLATRDNVISQIRGRQLSKDHTCEAVVKFARAFERRAEKCDCYLTLVIAGEAFLDFFEAMFRPGYTATPESLVKQAFEEAEDLIAKIAAAEAKIIADEAEELALETAPSGGQEGGGTEDDQEEDTGENAPESDENKDNVPDAPKTDDKPALSAEEVQAELARRRAEADAAAAEENRGTADEEKVSHEKVVRDFLIKDLKIDGRAMSAYARAQLTTVGDLLDIVETKKLQEISGIGDDFARETLERIEELKNSQS